MDENDRQQLEWALFHIWQYTTSEAGKAEEARQAAQNPELSAHDRDQIMTMYSLHCGTMIGLDYAINTICAFCNVPNPLDGGKLDVTIPETAKTNPGEVFA